MKKCPYCAEEIQDEAVKCRYCGERLKKRKKWLNCLLSCLLTFVILVISIILFIYLSFFLLKFVFYKIFFSAPAAPHSYPPFTGGGIEGVLRDFGDAMRLLWEKLKDFLHCNPQNYRVTGRF